MGNIGKNRSFSQKGFSKNFLGLMSEVERQKLCCLNFLEQVFSDSSNSIDIEGFGTDTSPLVISLKLSGVAGNILTINPDGLYLAVAQGLSVDENTNAVVLGQDTSVVGFPALISEDRVLPVTTGTNLIIQDAGDPNLKVFLTSTGINVQGDGANGGVISMQDFASDSSFILFRVPGEPYFNINWGNSAGPGPGGGFFFFDSGNVVLGVGTTATDNGAKLQVLGDVTTADPNSGVGKWKLGQVKSASVALDTTRYVEVNIDGTIVKLAVIN